jgi:serine protease AprX
MRSYTFLVALIMALFSGVVNAQIAPDAYYVQFTDKANSPYSVNNPEAFLTQRAIDRRVNQGIIITEHDLPVNPSYLDGVAALGPEMLFPTKWLNGVTIKTTSQAVLDAINDLPYVVSIRSFQEGELPAETEPKTFFANEFISNIGLPVTKSLSSLDYGSGFDQIDQINGIPLHEEGYLGEGMVIALLDGGYSNTDVHPAFDSIWINGQILGTKDFTQPGGNVFSQSSHGTAVLSTIASNVPGQLIGTAPKADFWLLRPEYVATENLIEEYNWVSAAEFADSVGADVINSSLGYINFDMPQHNHSYDQMDGNTTIVTIGADMAASKGILVVNSAGNSGGNSQFPYMGAPADGFDVFSIGAVDVNGDRASFSSIGPTYDGRIKPDVMARGAQTALATGSDDFGSGSGTSFSSPVLAGMATSLWQANPTFTNLEVKAAIMQSSNRAHNPDIYYGHGIPNFAVANWILTSLSDVGEEGHKYISIRPNPFGDQLAVTVLDTAVNKVVLRDAQGKLLLTLENKYSLAADLESILPTLKQGLYLLQLFTKDSQQTLKIVKGK